VRCPGPDLSRARPLGIKIIAGVLFCECVLLLVSVFVAYLLPDGKSQSVQIFLASIPYFKSMPIANRGPFAIAALAFATFAGIRGLGIWFMRPWARLLIMLDLTGRFTDTLLLMFLLDRARIHTILNDHDFVIGFLVNLCVLVILLDPNTARAFEKRSA
jgi:hypothetical protein